MEVGTLKCLNVLVVFDKFYSYSVFLLQLLRTIGGDVVGLDERFDSNDELMTETISSITELHQFHKPRATASTGATQHLRQIQQRPSARFTWTCLLYTSDAADE